MSEFTEAHSIAKLLGSPAGYIGYKDRNPIIEKIKQRPYSVILFDEVDKAHADIRKILLQILDEGYLSDNNSKKINLNHSLIILTSNLGSDLYKKNNFGFEINQSENTKNVLEKNILEKAKQELGNDLISRLNEICFFNMLKEEDVEKIIEKNNLEISKQLNKDLNKILNKKNIDELKKNINIKDFGARNIEKELEKIVHNFLLQEKEK